MTTGCSSGSVKSSVLKTYLDNLLIGKDSDSIISHMTKTPLCMSVYLAILVDCIPEYQLIYSWYVCTKYQNKNIV